MKRPPFISYCPHAHYVRNKYTGEMVCVPCRKCLSCLIHDAACMAARINQEAALHPYNLFFTLTYDNTNLPVAITLHQYLCSLCDAMQFTELDCILEFVKENYSDCDFTRLFIYVDLRGVVHLLDEDSYLGMNFLPPHPVDYCDDRYCFGVLSKIDAQRFIKRLRSLVKYDKHGLLSHLSKDQRVFRYYICGEYGPTTFRPHYHGLFFCDDEKLSQAIQQVYIYEAWQFCAQSRIDCQYVASSASSYVASYVSGSFYLPKVLADTSVRPFRLYSKMPPFGFDEAIYQEAFDAISRGIVARNTTIFDKDGVPQCLAVPYPVPVVRRLFPKCQDFKNLRSSPHALALRYFPSFDEPRRESLASSDIFYNASLVGVPHTSPWREANVFCARVAHFVCKRFGLTHEDYIALLIKFWSIVERQRLDSYYRSLEQSSSDNQLTLFDTLASSDDYITDLLAEIPKRISFASFAPRYSFLDERDCLSLLFSKVGMTRSDYFFKQRFVAMKQFDIPFLSDFYERSFHHELLMSIFKDYRTFFLKFYYLDAYKHSFCFSTDRFLAYVQNFYPHSVTSSYRNAVYNTFQRKLYQKKINNSPYLSLYSEDKQYLL